MTTKERASSRAFGGLIALLLATTACQSASKSALKVTTGAVGTSPASAAPAPDTTSPSVSTVAPAVETKAATTRRRTAAARPASRTPASAASTLLSRTDTGMTRLRVTIENQAAWTSMTLDGTSIVTSKVVETTGGARVTGLGPTISVADPGRAVIDFVLNIAPGAATGLSMCKNYLGPATVTLTRLTDGQTGVGSLRNTGTDPTVVDGCENPARVALDRGALIGPVRWPARQDARPLVLANYYPWYDETNVGHDFGDNPLGPVDTKNPDVVNQAINLAASNGIDGFVVEYEASPQFESRIDTVYRLADARKNFLVALTLDLAILRHRDGGLSDRGLDHAFHAASSRAHHASQLRKNGVPVVFVYGADKVDPGQWQRALDRQRAAGFAPFVIADDAALNSPGRFRYGTNDSPDLATLLRWAAGALFDLRARPGLTGETGPLWVAPVSPGYDDRRLRRSHPTYVDRAAGQRYLDSFTGGVAALPDWLMITSWNEYYEQTHIMAGTATGNRALDQTARHRRRVPHHRLAGSRGATARVVDHPESSGSRSCGAVWSARRPVKPEVAGSNPVRTANHYAVTSTVG